MNSFIHTNNFFLTIYSYHISEQYLEFTERADEKEGNWNKNGFLWLSRKYYCDVWLFIWERLSVNAILCVCIHIPTSPGAMMKWWGELILADHLRDPCSSILLQRAQGAETKLALSKCLQYIIVLVSLHRSCNMSSLLLKYCCRLSVKRSYPCQLKITLHFYSVACLKERFETLERMGPNQSTDGNKTSVGGNSRMGWMHKKLKISISFICETIAASDNL